MLALGHGGCPALAHGVGGWSGPSCWETTRVAHGIRSDDCTTVTCRIGMEWMEQTRGDWSEQGEQLLCCKCFWRGVEVVACTPCLAAPPNAAPQLNKSYQAKDFNSDKSLTFLVYGLMLSVGAQRDHKSYSLPSTRLNEMWRGSED